jgi:hypothetical protein
MVYPKFIVEDDRLIIAKCTYHKQLAIDESKIKGGGMWRMNLDDRIITLDGNSRSHDFGHVSFEDIKNCVKLGKVYFDKYETRNVLDEFTLKYDTGSETIILNK